MATATAPRADVAPTEAEIREAIRLRTVLFPGDNPQRELREAIEDYGAFMHGPAWEAIESTDPRDADQRQADADDIWADLRPSEARELLRLYHEAVSVATEAVERVIADTFTAAALEFAKRHPDARRAKLAL